MGPKSEAVAAKAAPFEIDSGLPFTIRVSNVPPEGNAEVRLLLPFGQSAAETFEWAGAEPGGEYVAEVDPGDYPGLAGLVTGAYLVEVTLNAPDRPPCSAATTVRVIGSESRPLAVASFWAAIASGFVGFLAALWTGINAYRRRGTATFLRSFHVGGVFATAAIGALAGLIATLALQQRGVVPLTTFALEANALSGALAAVVVAVLTSAVPTLLAGGRRPA